MGKSGPIDQSPFIMQKAALVLQWKEIENARPL
jgi:hypothetical protein